MFLELITIPQASDENMLDVFLSTKSEFSMLHTFTMSDSSHRFGFTNIIVEKKSPYGNFIEEQNFFGRSRWCLTLCVDKKTEDNQVLFSIPADRQFALAATVSWINKNNNKPPRIPNVLN